MFCFKDNVFPIAGLDVFSLCSTPPCCQGSISHSSSPPIGSCWGTVVSEGSWETFIWPIRDPACYSSKIEKLWDSWKQDIPSLDREDWEDCLEQCPKLVISSRDKLIQISFLHWLYYTPGRLQSIYPDRNPHCHRCQTLLDTYPHMFLERLSIFTFWSEVFELINLRLDSSVPMSLELALLGIHDDA